MNQQAMGLTLKKLRENKGLTQEQLASKLYVSRQNVSRWELGTRSINTTTLINICEIFDISIDEFFIKATDNCPLKEKNKIINIRNDQDKKNNTKKQTQKDQI